MDYVYSPLTPIADRWETSHRAGWALYWAHELKAKIVTTKDMATFADRVGPGDRVFVYHGMEFRDALNFPGGPPATLPARVKTLSSLTALGDRLISLDREMPNYARLLEKVGAGGLTSIRRHLAEHPEAWLPGPATAKTQHLIVGDSHSLALYGQRGTRIIRNDALTLHGALKSGMDHFFPLKGFKSITIQFGNIDIRHHLLRQPDVQLAVKVLVDEYVRQAVEVAKANPQVEVSLALPWPIETEERVLPKTGWFKGTPFYGSWVERTRVRKSLVARLIIKAANTCLLKDCVDPPKHFWNAQGELSLDVMEKPRSVHIRPSEYQLIQRGGSWASCVL